jgi:hypothetical protein
LRIRFTCLRERRRTHHKAPSNPAAWRYCWFSVNTGMPGKAQTLIPAVSYSPYRNPEAGGVHRRPASSWEIFILVEPRPVGNAQTLIPGISYNPYRNPHAWERASASGIGRPASPSDGDVSVFLRTLSLAGKRSDTVFEHLTQSVAEPQSRSLRRRPGFFFGLNGAPPSLTTGALAGGGVSLSLFGVGGIRRCRG